MFCWDVRIRTVKFFLFGVNFFFVFTFFENCYIIDFESKRLASGLW